MKRSTVILLVLVVLLVCTAVITPMLGSQFIGPEQIGTDKTSAEIFWQLRVPRLAMAMLAGAALSMAGVVFQAMFRNPLATPFTLGVSSGASLAAALAIRFDLAGFCVFAWWGNQPIGFSLATVLAFVGAMTSVLIVYGVARMRRGFSTGTLLLAGVSIGFICAAVIVLIQFLSEQPVTNAIVRWMMGSVEVPRTAVLDAVPLVAVGITIIWLLHKDLDLLMMGELVAVSRGVHVRRSRALSYFAASTVTGAVVAHCGPIGFVGLVVPHVMRFICGPGHRLLIPACLMAGAVFLPVCDMFARSLMNWLYGSPLEIPVGVLTNLLGGAFFLYILLTRRQESPIL